MSNPPLKLLTSDEKEASKSQKLKQVSVRNFWNTCPKKLDFMPTEECDLGKRSAESGNEENPDCEWSINSKDHHYCFWRYVQAMSLPDGRMDPLLQNEMATLLGCSSTKLHFILKAGLEKLKKSEFLEILESYHGEGVPAQETGTDVNTLIPADSEDGDY